MNIRAYFSGVKRLRSEKMKTRNTACKCQMLNLKYFFKRFQKFNHENSVNLKTQNPEKSTITDFECHYYIEDYQFQISYLNPDF